MVSYTRLFPSFFLFPPNKMSVIYCQLFKSPRVHFTLTHTSLLRVVPRRSFALFPLPHFPFRFTDDDPILFFGYVSGVLHSLSIFILFFVTWSPGTWLNCFRQYLSIPNGLKLSLLSFLSGVINIPGPIYHYMRAPFLCI